MPRRSLRVRPLVVVWPDASLDSPLGRQTDLRVVEQPAASSIGWPRHQMACGVGWLPASSISHPCRRSACHVVDCLAVDSLAVLSTGVWAPSLLRTSEPYLAGRIPSSSACRIRWHWVAHIGVGFLTSAFTTLRRLGFSNNSTGLPTSLWAALSRRSKRGRWS
jgi:hypothetical protein